MATTIGYALVISIILVIGGFLLQHGKKKEAEMRQGALHWPKTMGTVTGSEIREIKRSLTTFSKNLIPRIQSMNLYTPVIYYDYQVGGATYQSSKYRNGWLSRSGEWSSLLPQKVRDILADHPQGKSVIVIYNPENPAQAYLDLDTSTGAQTASIIGGYLLFAAAVLLLAVSAVRIGQDEIKKMQDRNIPAAIPIPFEAIKKSLTNDLKVTSCEAEKKTTHAQEITYRIWTCKFTSGNQTTSLLVYSREDDPEKVDRVVAFKGGLDAQSQLDFYEKLSILVAPTTDSSQVKKWLEGTTPAVTSANNKVETKFSGVKFTLNNENRLGASLEIGEAQ